MHYILDEDGNPQPVADVMEWAKWFEHDKRHVAKTYYRGWYISTVFLGLDHAWGEDNEPVLWETMVFGGPLDQEQDRCSGTRADAQAMHDEMMSRIYALKISWLGNWWLRIKKRFEQWNMERRWAKMRKAYERRNSPKNS